MKPVPPSSASHYTQVLGLGKLYPLPGYLPGFRQPALLAEVMVYHDLSKPRALARLDEVLVRALPSYAGRATLVGINNGLLQRLVWGSCAMLEGAGMPFFSVARLLNAHQTSALAWRYALALPCLGQDSQAVRAALAWVVSVMNPVLNGLPADAALATLAEAKAKIKRKGPRGFNTSGFLRAADATDIPWQRLMDNVYQFGWGANARLLDSSFTDATPKISASLARDKYATAIVLRGAGLPVPMHFRARNANQAVALADALGYPVVVKPADLDGGLGVVAGIRHADGVRKAYAGARALSASVLVEKHIEGNDYRLQVLQGRVFWAVHRVPGGVVGNGANTVVELLEALNADPRRGERGTGHGLKTITLDEEVLELLEEQELTLESVPETGRAVRMRRTANVASGGMPVPVLEMAHPDNLALGVRAARVLRLDLAGIDMLMPDIRRSWRETGAVICEVNAQPQMSLHLPTQVLGHLVDGNGRIPVVMILGDVLAAPWYRAFTDALDAGSAVGVATTQGTLLAGECIIGPGYALHGARALLTDPLTRALLVVADDEHMLGAGLPVDRLDALVLAAPLHAQGRSPDWERWEAWARTLAVLSKQVWVLDDSSEWLAVAARLEGEPAHLVDPQHVHVVLRHLLEGKGRQG